MHNLCHHHHRSACRFFLALRTKCSVASSKSASKKNKDMPKVIYGLAPAMDHKKELDIERNARVPSILNGLEKAKLTPEFRGSEIIQLKKFRKARVKDITSVYPRFYVSVLKQSVKDAREGKLERNYDSRYFGELAYVSPTSYEDSLVAAGSGLSLVDSVVAASKLNENPPVGFALMPPPKHHVGLKGSKGCCVFENVAIAARYAQLVHGLKRVFIIDFDVHFLYVTNDVFYDDPDVFVLSIHGEQGYQGKFDRVGRGNGEGATLNLPLPQHSGDIAMRTAFDEVIVPSAQRFKPDMILVSAGYDGHVADPTGNLHLTTGMYYTLASGIKQLAKDLCGGRCVFFLEGGQNQGVVSFSVAESFRAFVGESSMAPEFEKKYAGFLHDEPSSKIKQAIQRTKHLHSL